jgi:hypothetical protein
MKGRKPPGEAIRARRDFIDRLDTAEPTAQPTLLGHSASRSEQLFLPQGGQRLPSRKNDMREKQTPFLGGWDGLHFRRRAERCAAIR